MKKIFSLTIILSAIMVTSCKKDLNQIPISTGTTETFYRLPGDFIQGVNAVYNDLRGYPDRLLSLSEIRSDNIYGVSSLGVRDWDPINNFQKAISSNPGIEEAWNTDFNGIFRANVILDQLAKNGNYVNSASLALRLQAEAKFLRAFYYFDLIKYFGKLPIIDHPVTATESVTIGRSAVADVYKFVISDLQFAMANLPAVYTGVDVGRATKYAAEATLALVYMTRSGATYGIEGPGLNTNEWSLALPLLQDIISSGKFAFISTYSSVFSYTNQNNSESVFSIQYVSGQSPVLGATYPWDLAPNAYFQAAVKDNKSNGSLEIIPVSTDLINGYEPGDLRKAFSVFTAGYTFSGSFEGRPFFKKYLDLTKLPSASRFDWGIDFMAIRYTDVLMLKAECILRGATGGTQADVDAIVNQVRARAGLPAVANVTINKLFDERRKEFADEGSRWFDLQRSGNLLTIMNAWIPVEDAVKKQMSQVTANYVIYPVPQSQIDAQSGLYTQNPGY